MTKEQFVAYSLEKDELAEEDNAGSLFEIFDKDSSGSMDFSEFLMANQASKVYIIETVYRDWHLKCKITNFAAADNKG